MRGHASVALLSLYGAYSLKHAPVDQQEDAQRLFGRILEAEKSLWKVSALNAAAPAGATPEVVMLTSAAARHDRILDVAQVATAALKPAKRRLTGFFEKLGSLIATPTPTGAISALKDIRKAARRASVIALKGGDYITGTRELMKNIDENKGATPNSNDWKAIDTAFLEDACKSISFMAYGEFRTCIPTR